MLNANRVHGLWGAIIVYLVVLAVLRTADGWAIRNGWQLGRWLLKIVIWVVATALVSISGLEQCDLSQTNCHRIFF
jgi:hypothetical protein